jgi:nitrite reductase/ring-hydroxylating ferredoxin subunit
MWDDEDLVRNRWFPIARMEEVVPRHVVQAQLLGQEIALWRDDAGRVNAWENRCPHRGVRLSIGINDGKELRCMYHGWRYASGTGQCTFIPAHPDQKPPNVIRTKPYGVAEQYGFIWVNLGEGADVSAVPALGLNAWTTLRSVFVNAPVAAVAEALIAEGGESADGFVLTDPDKTTFLLQPVTEDQTVLHGLVGQEAPEGERLPLLRYQNARLSDLRDALEKAAA